MATILCRNGHFIWSPYPGHLQNMFPWPPEKNIYHFHGPLRLHSKFFVAATVFTGPTKPPFAQRSATIYAQAVIPEEEAERNQTSLPSLPHNVNSSLSIESWGSSYEGPFEAQYWNSNREFPYTVGYASIKTYKGKQFLQKIQEGVNGPLFLVEVIGENKAFSSKSPQKVWNSVVEEDGQNVQGARHFGFQSPDVIKALQTLSRLKKSSHTGGSVSEREPEHHGDVVSLVDKGQVSEFDEEFTEVETLFEVDSDDDNLVHEDERIVEDEAEDIQEAEEEGDDESDPIVAEAVSGQPDQEEEEEDDDDERDVLHNVEDHEDCDHDHELESEVDDVDEDEEDSSERDPLSYNVYSRKHRVHSGDDSPAFEDTEPLLSSYKQSFGSTYTRPNFGRYDRYDSMDEPYKEATEVANNDVYYPSDHGRFKGAGRIWRKGDSLSGPMGSHGKHHGTEWSGTDQRSPSIEGVQARASNAMNFNGSRYWDSPFTRKREENSKSSQMLLELLQKWNRTKKWNRELGATVRAESKNLQVKEDDEQQHDGSWGDERAFTTPNKVVFQARASEMAPKSNSNQRNYEAPDSLQNGVYFSESSDLILDEFKISEDLDESTEYAINKLFETVGQKEIIHNDFKSPSSLGKLSVCDTPGVINHVEKSWSASASGRSTGVVDNKTRLEWGHGIKFQTEVCKEAEKGLESDGASMPVIETGSEPTQLLGTLSSKKQIEGTRLSEDVRRLAGSKRYEDAFLTLKNAKASISDLQGDVYEALLGDVKLEAWQKQVFSYVQAGNSVLVSAPNGAGKSTVADCCLFRNFVEEHRTLFVTPSEPLANEKVHSLGTIFGHRNVGSTRARMLKDHKVGVITLEMLAKMLKELNGPGGSEFCFYFEEVKFVVLDKFHTFSDPKYVSLWEEVFMLMDSKIKVLALTLPADNEEQIVSWIDMYRGPCKLVSSRIEPVSRRYFFCHGSGFLPLLDVKGAQLNDDLCERIGSYSNTMTKEEIGSFFLSCYDKPSLRLALSLLGDKAMLPAFVVFFNIKSCDHAMEDAFQAFGDSLLSKTELAKLEVRINELGESHPDLLKHLEQSDREALRKGCAACHEGKLPAWQTFVLQLFQENILKVLMVTENTLFHTEVVARTLILPSTHKMVKDGVLPVCPIKLLPLIGSAGRRGYDIEGNIIFLKNFFTRPGETASLVLKNDFKFVSSYKPSYSLVVNLMAKYHLCKVKQLLSSTFHDVVQCNAEVRQKKIEDLNGRILDCLEAKADFEVRLFQGLAQVNKQKLADAAVFTRVDIRMTIHSVSHSGNAFPGFLLAVVPGQLESFYMVFGADNKFRLVPAGALDHVYTLESSTLDAQYKQSTGQPLQPPAIPAKESWAIAHDATGGYVADGDSQTRWYAKLLMDYPVQGSIVKEGLEMRKEILQFDTQISSLIESRRSFHTERQCSEPKCFVPIDVNAGAKPEAEGSDTWKEAMRLLKILEQVDALSLTESQGAHVKLKPLGMLISRLHNVDNELWLALVLSLINVKQLPPAEFLALIAATVPSETEVESLFNDQRKLLFRSTGSLKEAFAVVDLLRKQVAALQGSYTPPLHFCTTFAGMVYAWCRARPGTVGFTLENTNDGGMAWKLRIVTRYAHLISLACSQVSVDISEPNDFSNLSLLAQRAEAIMAKHLVATS